MSKNEEITQLSGINRCPTSKLVDAIEEYRVEHALSKTQIAKLLEMSASAYSNLFGRRNTDSEVKGTTVEKVSKALNIPISQILKMETKDERHQRVIESLPDFIIEWLGTANGRAAVFNLFKAHYEALQEHDKKLMLDKLRMNPQEAPEVWNNTYTDSNPKLEYTVEIHSAPPPWTGVKIKQESPRFLCHGLILFTE